MITATLAILLTSLVAAAALDAATRSAMHPTRAALITILLLWAADIISRLSALPNRTRLAGYLPPHMRISINEPAIAIRFGHSTAARALGLAIVHAGPVCMLSLCFQLGELWGKLTPTTSCPPTAEGLTAGIRMIGRMWDFSFGTEEPPPASLMRAVAREMAMRMVGVLVAAIALEWWLSSA